MQEQTKNASLRGEKDRTQHLSQQSAGRPHRAPILDVNKDSLGSLTCGGIGERNSQ